MLPMHQAVASMVEQAKAAGDVVSLDTAAAAAPAAPAAATAVAAPAAAAAQPSGSSAPDAAAGSGAGGSGGSGGSGSTMQYTADFVDAMLMLVSALVGTSQVRADNPHVLSV
jgi:hypothetical protein